ncbi:MAG: pyridoxal-phosphate dependent enzyme, partial [Pseudomonadales bacterium]|nr:pyridoxal-phosphate dependent enzyme [Pseudomonadales bacterium]
VEGTAGNTGIGLVHICNARSYECVIFMPDNQSPEKARLLQTLGATVHQVPAVPFKNPNNFQKQAGRYANKTPGAVWTNQFDNTANRDIHYRTTGPEIWRQTQGQVNAFVSASGTGGTIAGVSRYLKEQNKQIQVILADPMGSALFNYVNTGETLMSKGPSITEGIGNSRITKNFSDTHIDGAVQVQDQEMIDIIYKMLHEEGWFLGSSTGINLFAAVSVALKLGPGHTVVTMLCDGGEKYQSRLFNPGFLLEKGLYNAYSTHAAN